MSCMQRDAQQLLICKDIKKNISTAVTHMNKLVEIKQEKLTLVTYFILIEPKYDEFTLNNYDL